MFKQENITASLYPNQFVTKTCLTTYTYLKTYIRDGKSTVESLEKVISNIATEERNTIQITPTPTAGITLSQVRTRFYFFFPFFFEQFSNT